ncbi:hypothetical protein FF2_035823 [Malus domestica]
MVVKDEWTRAVVTDDVLVVELLLRLKQTQAAGPSSPMSQSLLTLRWGVRMPHSKTATSDSRFDGNVLHQRRSGKNGADSTTRCSPMTPLSWSGSTGSPSATPDDFKESSCPRSKLLKETVRLGSFTTVVKSSAFSTRCWRSGTFPLYDRNDSNKGRHKGHYINGHHNYAHAA